MATLSTIAAFDDLRRNQGVLSESIAEEEFKRFLELQRECRKQWTQLIQNEQRLQRELDAATKTMSDLETKLHHARKLLEQEGRARRLAENDRDQLEKKMVLVRELLHNDRGIKDETRSKLDFLNNVQRKRKSAHLLRVEEQLGNEINSTGSFLSDLSLTQSEDDILEINPHNRSWKKHRPSYTGATVSRTVKKRGSRDTRRSSAHKMVEITGNEKIVAHAKVTVPQDDGPILAESVVEAVPNNNKEIDLNNLPPVTRTPYKSPKKAELFTPSAPPLSEINSVYKTPATIKRKDNRHDFSTKTVFRSETCNYCEKRIRFGCVGLKCKTCRVWAHSECADKVTIVCIPQSAGTPHHHKAFGTISDYVTEYKPMIPTLLIHCIDEIEKRGFTEVGIYRISGSEREVKALKEKFIRNKSVPCLNNIDVHVICGCVKDFLRSLQDKLVPSNMWSEFSNAVQTAHPDKVIRNLKMAVEKLPEPNRDTLAFVIQHLQRIADKPVVKMPLDNLAKIFAPTLIGHSSQELDTHQMYAETMIQVSIMSNLLSIPGSYWSQFTNINLIGYSAATSSSEPERDLGVLHPTGSSGQNEKYYSGTPLFRSAKKDRKFYATPPYPKKK